MVLLALTGAPCAGKSTTANHIRDAGYPVVSMGDELRRRERDSDEDAIWALAENLREEHGPHGVATVVKDPIEDALDDACLVALEGCRNPAELSYLRAGLEIDTAIVWITAPWEDRLDRFKERDGRNGDEDELIDRERRERKAGLVEFQIRSNYRIHNDEDVESLRSKTLCTLYDVVEDSYSS